jgi:SAM-dependent methyltransferase
MIPATSSLRSRLETISSDADALLDHGRYDLSYLLPAAPSRVLEIGGDHGLGAVCSARLGHQVTHVRRPGDGNHIDERFAEERTSLRISETFADLEPHSFDAVVVRSPSRDDDLGGNDAAAAIATLANFLTPNGLLIVADRNRWSWIGLGGFPDPVDGHRWGMLRGRAGWSATELRAAIRSNGLQIVHEFGAVPHDRSTRQLATLVWEGRPTAKQSIVQAYEQFANEVPGHAVNAVAAAHKALPARLARSIVPATVFVASASTDPPRSLAQDLSPSGVPTVFSGRGLTDTVTFDLTSANAGFVKYSRSSHRWSELFDLLERASHVPGLDPVGHRLDSLGSLDLLRIAPAHGRQTQASDVPMLAATLGALHRQTSDATRTGYETTSQGLGAMDGVETLARAARRNPDLHLDVERLGSTLVTPAVCHFDWGRRNARIAETGDVVAFDWDLGDVAGAAEVDIAQFVISEPTATIETIRAWEDASGIRLLPDHLTLGLASLGVRWPRPTVRQMADKAAELARELRPSG